MAKKKMSNDIVSNNNIIDKVISLYLPVGIAYSIFLLILFSPMMLNMQYFTPSNVLFFGLMFLAGNMLLIVVLFISATVNILINIITGASYEL
ncbi:MAG: hypothetical protein QXP59_02630 [Saccharolobus sp.]